MSISDSIQTPLISIEMLTELLANKRELSDDEIGRLLKKIRPIITCKNGAYYVKLVDPRNVSYNWNPTLIKKAKDLVEAKRIITLHTFSHQCYFTPSIAEVLSMIPIDIIDQCKAFETIDAYSLNDQQVAINAGYHAGITILYA